MIDFAQKTKKSVCTTEEVNAKFLELMPKIIKNAKYAFQHYTADRREDAIQSVLVTAFENIKQLAEQGRLDDAFALPISKFAIGRYREGRPGGLPSCSTDVTSERCRYLGRSTVKNYGLATEIADSFESMATATDARYPIHKTVQLRIDFMQNWCPVPWFLLLKKEHHKNSNVCSRGERKRRPYCFEGWPLIDYACRVFLRVI